MKQIFISLALLALLAAGCQKVVIKQEVPSSPKESYEPLPR
jgi:PBP1b-binding outer membrane lipoprotein LpoB